MSELVGPDPLQQLWQKQTPAMPRLSLQFIRYQALDLERRTARRNLQEYAVGVLGVAAVAWLLWAPLFPHPVPVVKLGWGLFAAATLFTLYCVRRDAAARALPADAGSQPMPAASTWALASMISASVTCSTTPSVHSRARRALV